MASTILGIDLGSYAVKVARIEAGFRSAQLVGIFEARVPGASARSTQELAPAPYPGEAGQATTYEDSSARIAVEESPEDNDLLSRQLQALDLLLGELKTKGETVVTALSHGVTLRMIDVPLSDPKKVEQALPFELGGQLMTELDEQVVDQVLVKVGVKPTGGGEAGSQWLAACVDKTQVRGHLERLLRHQIDPRRVGSLALATAALFVAPAQSKRASKKDEGGLDESSLGPPMPLWVIDIGHHSTHVCAVARAEGKPGQVVVPFARTIPRGGLALTQALERARTIPFAKAELLKHENGLDDSSDPETAETLRRALKPLLRELRQTLSAFAARTGETPKLVYVCGGSAELRGLLEHMQHELDLDVLPLTPPPRATWFGGKEAAQAGMAHVSSSLSIDTATLAKLKMPSFALLRHFSQGAPAVGLALSMLGAAAQVNFRKGGFAYRTDYALLKERAPYVAAFFVALLVCMGGWVYASMHTLEKENERLSQRLAAESATLFGESKKDGAAVLAELNSVLASERGGDRRVPQVSALDLLELISRAAPEKSNKTDSRLEVVDLQIKPKKLNLKATAASAQYVEEFAAALGKLACVKGVQKGKVLTVKNIGTDGKPIDVKQFTLELTTTCP